MRKILTNSKHDEIEIRKLSSGAILIHRWDYIGSTNHTKNYKLNGECLCYSEDQISPIVNDLANGEKFK